MRHLWRRWRLGTTRLNVIDQILIVKKVILLPASSANIRIRQAQHLGRWNFH